MRRTVYYAIEAIAAFIVSLLIWYFILTNLSFDFYHNSDDTLEGIIILSGLVLYVILVVLYIVLGFKKVKGWRWWMSIITVIVSVAMGFVGLFAAVNGSEFINRIIH